MSVIYWRRLIRPIGFMAVRGDTVYFTATSGINDKLYALTVSNSKLYELKGGSLQSFTGNYEPAIAVHKLAWVSFSAYGYQVHQADNSNIQWTAIDETKIPAHCPILIYPH